MRNISDKRIPVHFTVKSAVWLILWILHQPVQLRCQEDVTIKNQVIVMLQRDQPVEPLLAHLQQTVCPGIQQKQVLSRQMNIHLIEFDASCQQEDLPGMIAAQPGVRIAQYNHRIEKRSVIPDDPFFNQQWNLHNTGQTGGYIDADIDAPEAWDYGLPSIVTANGDTLVIAVVDGGVDLAHEDLRYWKNRHETPGNGIDDDGNGFIDDYDGWNAGDNNGNIPVNFHGCGVVGIAAACGNNQKGIAGVHWGVPVLPVALIRYVESEVVIAYDYILTQRRMYDASGGQRGAYVVAVNSSFGIDRAMPQDYPLWCAMYDSLGKAGVLSIAATTNSNINVDIEGDIPTTCPSPYLIAVTSTTHYDRKNTLAGWGIQNIDMGAPGAGIYSTAPGNSYAGQNGTSMAAPHVTGAVSYLYSLACPELLQLNDINTAWLPLIIKDILFESVDSLAGFDTLTRTGGRLNLANAAELLVNQYCNACAGSVGTVMPVSCADRCDGEVFLNIDTTGHRWTVRWSDGDSALHLPALCPGLYSATITDDSSCTQRVYVSVTSPLPIEMHFYYDTSAGVLQASVSGGIPPYLYQWLVPSGSGNMIDVSSGGWYILQVTDGNQCMAVDSVFLVPTGFSTHQQLTNNITVSNPAVDQWVRVYTEHGTDAEEMMVTCYDVGGREYLLPVDHTGGNARVRLPGTGIYFLRLFSPGGAWLGDYKVISF